MVAAMTQEMSIFAIAWGRRGKDEEVKAISVVADRGSRRYGQTTSSINSEKTERTVLTLHFFISALQVLGIFTRAQNAVTCSFRSLRFAYDKPANLLLRQTAFHFCESLN